MVQLIERRGMFQVERRQLDRFVIKGAVVKFYSKDGSYNLIELTDVSKSGIRFKINGDFNKGDMLDFELFIPFKEKILLKGIIIRKKENDCEVADCNAVQFAPFGSDERYNSSTSYKQLSQLIEECQETLESL